MLAGTGMRPAREVLPAPVTRVEPVLTALAVLAVPGLLTEWWPATADAGRS